MKSAAAVPRGRLAALTVLVLAAHAVFLAGGLNIVGPSRNLPVHFMTRMVRAAPPAPPAPPVAAPTPPRPPEPSRRRPEPLPAVDRPPPRSTAPEAPVAAVPLARNPLDAKPPAALPAPEESAPPAPPAAPDTQPPQPDAPATLPATAEAYALPGPVNLRYDLSVQTHGITIGGQARLDWRHDGEQYEARLELSSAALPSRVTRSVGRITEQGLAPSYFSDKTRSEQATHFDREQNRVVFSNNAPVAQLVPGLQDRLSLVMQIAALVRGDPARFGTGTWINVPTAASRETENWVFSVEGEEDLDLPGGKVHALKLQRLPRKEFDQRIELWLAPGMDYAPVRVRLTNPNGDTVDQRWSSTDKG